MLWNYLQGTILQINVTFLSAGLRLQQNTFEILKYLLTFQLLPVILDKLEIFSTEAHLAPQLSLF